MIKEIRPKEAHEMLEQQKDAVLIDVRSTMEYEYVGHPLNAMHAPIKEPPDWVTQPDFVKNIRLSNMVWWAWKVSPSSRGNIILGI